MSYGDLSAREVLFELGLAGVDDPGDAERCLRAFLALLEYRLGRRLSMVLGASVSEAIGTAPESEARASFELLQRSLPEYSQYVDDEFERIKTEFQARLAQRLAADPDQAKTSTQ